MAGGGLHSGKYNRRTAVVEAVEKVGKAVVNISAETMEEAPITFFNPHRRYYRQTSIGSGLIFHKDGYVVTNNHVIEKAISRIKVTTHDGEEYDADLIGGSSKFDLAILKVNLPDPEKYYQPLGCSDDILIGESVIAIGNSLGLSHTVTTGIVSAVDRSLRDGDQVFRDFIQTDASINPGNSGGPLLNINGDVIGINTAIINNSQGIGFAIPANVVKKVLNDLLQFGETRTPYFGILIQDLTPMLREYASYEGPAGVLITEVYSNGPGDLSGLRRGDVLLSLSNEMISSVEDYRTLMMTFTYDETVMATVWRDGKEHSFSIRGSTFPEETLEDVMWDWLGIQVIDNSIELARKHRLPDSRGVVVKEVRPDSRADKIGLAPGDILWQVNRKKVGGLKSFRDMMIHAINQNSDEVAMVVQRRKHLYYVSL